MSLIFIEKDYYLYRLHVQKKPHKYTFLVRLEVLALQCKALVLSFFILQTTVSHLL